MDEDRLATPQEVGDYLRKPLGTLAQWRHRGEGPPFVKVGREVRYRWHDIHSWIDGQRNLPRGA